MRCKSVESKFKLENSFSFRPETPLKLLRLGLDDDVAV